MSSPLEVTQRAEERQSPSSMDSHEPSRVPSPAQTMVDLNGNSTPPKGSKPNHTQHPVQRTEQDWVRAEEAPAAAAALAVAPQLVEPGAELKLTQKRKYLLLTIFGVAQYLDVLGYSGLFIFTEAIANDLDILYQSSSWIITAYSVTFASFLLFWGRVADLYSAKPVFCYGFVGVAITNLIISFMPNQYAYFVFRAISGIFGAATIPSAFRLILAVFEPHELQFALTIFGLSGAIANITGLIIAAFFGFIKADNQLAGWRWFFRFITIVIVPFAVLAFALVPKTKGAKAEECTCEKDRFKRLDLFGCFTMLVGIILLVLGMTLGASYGWRTAKFLVPFLMAWVIFFPLFFIWEARVSRQGEDYALLPTSFWKIPNMPLLLFFALGIYPWWAVNQLPLVERFLEVFNEEPIIAAVRMLPQGIAALLAAMVVPSLLQKLGNARWPCSIGMLLGAVGYLSMIYCRPDGDIHHYNYWRWYFPAFIIGSAATMMAFLGVNITIMTSVPPEASGVAGAALQVALQVGAVIGLSIQAGLLTVRPGSIYNYANVQISFWFQFGWCLFNMLVFLIFFRPGKAKSLKPDPSGEPAAIAV